MNEAGSGVTTVADHPSAAFEGVLGLVRRNIALVLFWLVCFLQAATGSYPADQDWTNYVRIGAYSLKADNADEIVRSAQQDGVFGIEVDNDIPGRYESFQNPAEKLKAIRALAARAHTVGNRAFVYIAGTECITAHADQTAHTLAKDHPDWLQRKLTGEPAVFGGGTAFWIKPGDEDVWISPFAPTWRQIYMERIRQIAATGIDGIYVDIPYWMTHFEGWEDSWASFDNYTVRAFKERTGLDARTDMKLGEFSDPNFRKWLDFRIEAITDFVRAIDQTAKSVNPQIKTIPEIYPGIEEEAVRVGSDVYSLYPMVDAIAHEYEFGEGNHMASSRTPLDWFCYQVGMYSFRAFAEGKATWILNYSWDGDQKVDRRQSMVNLAMSEIMAGANFWDAPGHSMAGSNDLPTRRTIFSWIKAHENTFYRPRNPIDPIGVYFSPETRNLNSQEFISSYRGILILLMQKHLEFEVVTPRTLSKFQGKILIFSDAREISSQERSTLEQYLKSNRTLIITGKDATGLGDNPRLIRFSRCPGKDYMAALQKDFETATPEIEEGFLRRVENPNAITVLASPRIATSISQIEGKPHVFFANFAGLRGGANPIQTPQTDVRITVPSANGGKGFFLPFLGEVQEMRGVVGEKGITYKLPAIEQGAVFWYGRTE